MELNTILLVFAAVLPAIILCIYVYKKDRVEKEPWSLLTKLFVMGALSCFPAYIFEVIILGAYEFIFIEFYPVNTYVYNFIYYFLGVAVIEEGLKWVVFKRYAMRDENFDCLFDGLIYAIFVSLGFAALENILYVLENGWINAFTRAVLSVPGHMFFSVMMGYHLSMWKIFKDAKAIEDEIKDKNKPSLFNEKRELVLSILIPVIIHGIYNYCCSAGSTLFTVIFLAFILSLYFICFGRIKKMSNTDDYSINYSIKLVLQCYPEFKAEEVSESFADLKE